MLTLILKDPLLAIEIYTENSYGVEVQAVRHLTYHG
jgi:hypothetical protein